MKVTITVTKQIAAEAHAQGVPVEVYVEEILARRTINGGGESQRTGIAAAVDRIIELRKGNRLEGRAIKDLIREGRKY